MSDNYALEKHSIDHIMHTQAVVTYGIGLFWRRQMALSLCVYFTEQSKLLWHTDDNYEFVDNMQHTVH